VLDNPTRGLALPAYRGRRERVARPEEATALLAALPTEDRAVWATALYAGLRRGELRALQWGDVDFDHGVIRVERSWDDKTGPIAPKSRAGRRRVPLAKPLRTLLTEHRLHQPPSTDLVFGRSRGRPLAAEALTQRARRIWSTHGVSPIGLHECRHTYASYMIAAGVNAKSLSSYMGHSSITDDHRPLRAPHARKRTTRRRTARSLPGSSSDLRTPPDAGNRSGRTLVRGRDFARDRSS